MAKALAEDCVLVEFVRFRPFDFGAVARGQPQFKPSRYLAFVLPGGAPDAVQMVDLGPTQEIDQLIADFRAETIRQSQEAAGRDLGGLPAAPIGLHADGQALRRALVDPLLPAMEGRTSVLLAPEGDLTRLPFGMLPTQDGRRLIETFDVRYVATGRDVLRFGQPSARRVRDAVVIADPNFDLAIAGTAAKVQDASAVHLREIDRAGLHFRRLPGTRAEGERISQMLGVEPWLESTAVKRRLKGYHSPHVLHIATHGFFLPDQRANRILRFDDPPFEETTLGRISEVARENPLLRCGVALAGANAWLKRQAVPPEVEDGLLTAEDVSGLDLLDTELVVLSACETGLGEVHVGEGVLGLRRAFVIAGAKGLVMSLWKVPDQQTQELMTDFYSRLSSGQGRATALRKAQLAMMSRYRDPLAWGAFIYQGDPGPLGRYEPSGAGESAVVPPSFSDRSTYRELFSRTPNVEKTSALYGRNTTAGMLLAVAELYGDDPEDLIDRLREETKMLRATGQNIGTPCKFFAFVADLYHREDYAAEALLAVDEAIVQANKENDAFSEASLLVNKGRFLVQSGLLDLASGVLEAALSRGDDLGNPDVRVKSRLWKAELLSQRNQEMDARSMLDGAMRLARQANKPHLILECLTGFVTSAVRADDLATARGYLADAKNLAVEIGNDACVRWCEEVGKQIEKNEGT